MRRLTMLNIILSLLISVPAFTQNADSSLSRLKKIPVKYITNIDKKVTLYSSRISSKTEKTLERLSKWENKIHRILMRANPVADEQLFGKNKTTFTTLLLQMKTGEKMAMLAQAPYESYRDNITTTINYLSQQKGELDSGMIKKINDAQEKIKQLSVEENHAEAMQQFIKNRKKQLMEQAFRQVGASRYLNKMNKEVFYYTETLKNYKELFTDSKKAEEIGKTILNSIPAFNKFMQQNSQLASLFGQSGNGTVGVAQAGLQTRVSVQNLIQDRIASGGPNAEQELKQNLQQAQAELKKFKDKFASSLSGDGGDMPDFIPKMQKTKTFKQRLEFGSNLQFSQTDYLMPATSDIGLSIGYKLNDKSIVGIGGSYKLGLGKIDHISFSNQGASIRSFTDWKLKKQFYISGGFEMNYLAKTHASFLLPVQQWQQSGLLGISKKISIKTKYFRETKVQLLYDFLSQQHLPVSQPLLFRVGYSF